MAQILVAIQGERGSFSEEAAGALLGRSVRVLPKETFAAIFKSAAGGEARYCLAPIENTLAGSVYENYDLLLENDLHIVAEANLRIVHNLIAFPGTTMENLRQVYSQPYRRACLWRAHPPKASRRSCGKLHALPAAVAHVGGGGGEQQDLYRVFHPQRSRSALQVPQRFRAARYRLDQNGISPLARTSVGILLLPRFCREHQR